MSETANRLLNLLSLLQAPRHWTGPQLAARLEVTVRTVRRDVDRLRSLGYPVDSTAGPDGGYRLAAGASMPPLVLDDAEAVAVAVCLRAGTNGSVADVADAAISALAKLEGVLPTRLRPQVAALGSMTVSLSGVDASGVDPATLVTIAQACRESLVLRFGYRDGHGRSSERRTEPFRLVHTGRRWYLVARDQDRSAWRTFRVDRMVNPTCPGHRFVRSDPPDAARFVAESITTNPYRHQASVLLHAPAAVAAERVPPTVGVVEAIDVDTSRLTTGADDLTALAIHLALLGVDFTVEAPAALATLVRQLGDRLLSSAGVPGSTTATMT